MKALLKEYTFTPSNKQIALEEGVNEKVNFKAIRVAYSCFGKVQSLVGDAEKSVTVFARSVDAATEEYEETQTDENGNFRIRGLKPGLKYRIAVKSNDRIEIASPSFYEYVVTPNDIQSVQFIAFRTLHKFDIYGSVRSTPENLKSLSVRPFPFLPSPSPSRIFQFELLQICSPFPSLFHVPLATVLK